MWWTIPARAATGEPQTRIQLVGVPEVPVHELILPVAVPAANGGGTFVDARGQVLTAEREGGPGEDDLWWVRLPDAPPEAAVWWRPGASNAHLPWEPYRWVHHMDGRRAAWGAPLSGPAGVVGAGKFGRAQFLDGQHADVGPLGTHTFSAWVIVDPGITTPLVAHAAWVLTVEPSGVAALELGGTRSTGLVPLTDGEWHHLAVTVRPGHAALFVDGAREATADVDATAGSYGVLWFGRAWWDEVRVAPTAHTPEWIAADAALAGALVSCDPGTPPLQWRQDGDDDGVLGPVFEGCDPPSDGYALDDGSPLDCADDDPRRFPGADEPAGVVDRDCDGFVVAPGLSGGCATSVVGGWWAAALAVWWRRGAPRDPVASAPARLP